MNSDPQTPAAAKRPRLPRPPISQTGRELLTTREVALFLGLSQGTIYNLMKGRPANAFPSNVDVGVRGMRFRRIDIQLYSKHGRNWRDYLPSDYE